MAGSALLSIAGAVLFSRWLKRTGPVRAVPVVQVASGCIFLVEWFLLDSTPRQHDGVRIPDRSMDHPLRRGGD